MEIEQKILHLLFCTGPLMVSKLNGFQDSSFVLCVAIKSSVICYSCRILSTIVLTIVKMTDEAANPNYLSWDFKHYFPPYAISIII